MGVCVFVHDIVICMKCRFVAFSSFALLVGHNKEHLARKNWKMRLWGVVTCPEWGADCLVRLMPLARSPIVFCLVKMQNGFFSGTNVPRLSWKERLLNRHLWSVDFCQLVVPHMAVGWKDWWHAITYPRNSSSLHDVTFSVVIAVSMSYLQVFLLCCCHPVLNRHKLLDCLQV